MSELNHTSDLSAAVRAGMHRADACSAVRELYLRLQREIDQRKPLCVASGKCCHFEAYGHRLYVTTLELATFAVDRRGLASENPDQNRPRSNSLPVYRDRESEGCPLQVGTLCGVHAIRPFGCRIFFCDPTATDWQQQQYERFHAELKQLHERFDVAYFYVEWRTGLGAIGD